MVALNRNTIVKKLLQHQKELNSFGIRKLGLFGSASKNKATSKSDLDFIVDFKEKNFDNYMGLKIYLEDLFHRRVDLVLPNTIKPRLRRTILKETKYVQGL